MHKNEEVQSHEEDPYFSIFNPKNSIPRDYINQSNLVSK